MKIYDAKHVKKKTPFLKLDYELGSGLPCVYIVDSEGKDHVLIIRIGIEGKVATIEGAETYLKRLNYDCIDFLFDEKGAILVQ